MERIDFIKQCGKLCLGGLFVTELLQSCTGNYFAISKMQNNQITLSKNEFIEMKNGKTKIRKFVLLRTEKLNFPICVYRLDENHYSALYMECTHNHCELNPNGDFLVCPCHGSEFNNKGQVQNPPAENDLQTFKVIVDHENIYVQL